MPRPKIRPQDRQRSVKACVPCRKSKIRCDAQLPCAMCTRRGREADCSYDFGQSRRSSQASPELRKRVSINGDDDPDSSHDRSEREQTATTDTGGSSTRGIGSPRGRTLIGAHMNKGEFVARQISSWRCDNSDSMRSTPGSQYTEASAEDDLFLCDDADHVLPVYVGPTASLSYLQFLRQVVRRRIGACSFTENKFSNYMLETGAQLCASEAPIALNGTEAEALVHSFFDATSGILDLYPKNEILTLLRQQSQRVYLILAVGAQCRGNGPQDSQLARDLFAKGRTLAFQNMLVDPSLEMVSDFLVMAFYMLGACSRNAGYMYLGVACKAASALGLHRVDQYRSSDDEDRQKRLNVWKSCCVLDMIVNSILGRGSGSPTSVKEEQQLHAYSQSMRSSQSLRSAAVQANFDICPYMNQLERHGGARSRSAAEESLQRLQEWSKALPLELRKWTGSSLMAGGELGQEQYLGAMHVACMYYFAVILTTRRFLTIYLMPQAYGSSRSGRYSKSSEASESEGLAHVCLTAAVNLAKASQLAKHMGCMLRNMCIMKAWVFAAGLLLGFALFAQLDDSDREIEEAFQQARDVLRFLAPCSPQAEHYYEILSSLDEAAAHHRSKAANQRKKTASRYMDQLFTFEATSTVEPAPSSLGTDSSAAGSAGALHIDGLDFSFDKDFSGIAIDPSELPDLDLLPPDDFTLDWQPLAPMFDDLL